VTVVADGIYQYIAYIMDVYRESCLPVQVRLATMPAVNR
jgi:hypothetical protein